MTPNSTAEKILRPIKLNLRLSKNHKAQIFVLGFCLLTLLPSISALARAQEQARGHFIVIPSDDNYADSAYAYLNYFQDKIAKMLGSPLDTTVTLYIAHNEDEFMRDTGMSLPDWGAGVAIMEQNKIVIKSPKAMQVGKSYGELIGHELTHIMLNRAAHGHWLPRWLHEGLAMYVSGEWHIGQDILVARAAWTGNLVPLSAMEDLTTFKGPLANLAYTESYLAVARLLKQHDPYILPDVLEAYRRSGDFYSSWRIIMGQDYVGWINQWLTDVSRQYHFFIFILDNETFWIIVAIVFIILFVWKKRQNARTKRRWQIEERLHPPDDSYKQYYDGYYDEEDQI